MGIWYEAERFWAVFQLSAKCVVTDHSLDEDGSIKIKNSQISSLFGLASGIEAIARFGGSSNYAKLSVTFQSILFDVEASFWVLGTDYDNWAVLWNCRNYLVMSDRYAWILTREKNPPASVLEEAYKVLDKNGISKANLRRTDQKNCS